MGNMGGASRAPLFVLLCCLKLVDSSEVAVPPSRAVEHPSGFNVPNRALNCGEGRCNWCALVPTRRPAAPAALQGSLRDCCRAAAAADTPLLSPLPAGAMASDPTPRTLRRAAAAEFGESLRSPSVQKYLAGSFGSPAAAAPPAPGGGGAHSTRERGAEAEARLQQVLASIRSKEERAGSALAGTIGAYHEPNGAASPTPAQPAQPPAAQPGQLGASDSLTADYRLQLQRYAQQLAAKDAEAAQLRRTVTELRQAAAAAESRAAHAAEQVARRDAAASTLEQQAAALERQLAECEAELAAAQHQRRAAEQAAASARAQAAAVHKAADARAADFEEDRKYFQQQLERRDGELHRCRTESWDWWCNGSMYSAVMGVAAAGLAL